MLEDRVAVLINPKAKGNIDDPHLGDRLRKELGDHGTIFEIADVNDLPKIIDQIIDEGYSYVASFGGDGTLQKHKSAYLRRLADRNKESMEKSYAETGNLSSAKIISPAMIVPGRRGTVNYVAKNANIEGTPKEIIRSLVNGIRSGVEFDTHTVQTLEVRTYPEGQPDNIQGLEYGYVFGAAGVTHFLDKYYANNDTDKIREVSKFVAEHTIDQSLTFEMIREITYDVIETLFKEKDIQKLRGYARSLLQATGDRIAKKFKITGPPSAYLDKLFEIGFDRFARTKKVSDLLDKALVETFEFGRIDRPDAIKAFRIILKGISSLALGIVGFPTTYHKDIIDPDRAEVKIYGCTTDQFENESGELEQVWVGTREILPYDKYNFIIASSMKINTIGFDAFYRLDKENTDGRIHLLAGNEPYVSLVRNFLGTWGGNPHIAFKNAHDCLMTEAKIRLKGTNKYMIDAEIKYASDVIELRPGPVLHIPKLFNGNGYR